MAKIITKAGMCSTRKKALGFQFTDGQGGKYVLSGSYSASGDIIETPESLTANLLISDTYKGCKLCGNKYAYVCPNCGTVTCYNGTAQNNVTCQTCNSVLDIPAASGKNFPTPTLKRKTTARRETVHLEQGDIVRIVSSDDKPMTKIEVHVMWDKSLVGDNMDVDSSVVVAGAGGKELIYYAHKEHESGCVIHHGDNLTGGNDGERISVRLDKVPSNRNALYFVLNIYECVARHQTLATVRNMAISICDPDSGQTLCEYTVKTNARTATALVLGKAYRSGGEWLFKAIGDPSNATTVGSVADEAVRKY